MADVDKKWYVVRAISGKEKKVKDFIESEIKALGLDDFVAQVLIPTEKVYQIRNGKKVSKERNFFPGYVQKSEESLFHCVNQRLIEFWVKLMSSLRQTRH